MVNNFEDLRTHLEFNRKQSNTKLIQPKPCNVHSSNPRSVDNAGPNTSRRKLHLVQIEKGMMSTKVVDKLTRNFNYDIQAQSFRDNTSNNNMTKL